MIVAMHIFKAEENWMEIDPEDTDTFWAEHQIPDSDEIEQFMDVDDDINIADNNLSRERAQTITQLSSTL